MPRARNDLLRIGDHIAVDSPPAAEKWLARLATAAERAASAPLSGRRVPEVDRDDVRETLEGRYRIVYRMRERRIDILSVFEGHRLFAIDDDELA